MERPASRWKSSRTASSRVSRSIGTSRKATSSSWATWAATPSPCRCACVPASPPTRPASTRSPSPRWAGRAEPRIDGDLVFDGVADPPPPGRDMFGMASEERGVALDLVVGQSVDLTVEFATTGPGIMRGVRIGCRLPEVTDRLDRAAAIAATADAAIVVVGNSAEWESEGRDRESMDLPGDQDELVRRVAAANPNTVVVVNTGCTRDDGLGRRGPGGAAVLVRWPGDGQRARRHPHRRHRSRRPLADHGPASTRAQPLIRQFPGRERRRTATAKACSSATAGTTRATCRCASRSATACRTPPSRSGRRARPRSSRAASRS